MENIVQAVESAIGAVETEAKKVETFAYANAVNAVRAVDAEGKAIRTEFVTGLQKVEGECEHVVECIKCHASYVFQHAPKDITQAERDTREDALVMEGAFMRFLRLVWSHV